MQNLKKSMSDRKTRHSSLNEENNRGITNDVRFAYVYEKINILLSVLSIYSFFFMILTWIRKVLHT